MASRAISSSTLGSPTGPTDVVPRRRLWPVLPDEVGPRGAVGEIPGGFFGDDAIEVCLRLGLQVLGGEIGNGAVPDVTPSKDPLVEEG
jgi:hypothetical protein